MKNKKPVNKFDILVERFIGEFAKIPNLDLTSTDEIGNKVFNIITFRIAEVATYKELVCQHFIPATNKAIFDGRKDIENSKYKYLLDTDNIDFKETLYDTIRLAYVGLFHKLENYINDVVKIPELIFEEFYETNETVEKWAKEKFKFDIKNWQQFPIIYKINWICNCVKHKDSFPKKEPKPIGFIYADETKRINILPDEFRKDCELLIEFYPVYIQIISMFAQHKLMTEKPIIEEDYIHSPDIYKRQLQSINDLNEKIQQFVDHLKIMSQ